MKNIFLIVVMVLGFFGCSGILPYKTEFDCSKEPGGSCKGISENIKDAYSYAYQREHPDKKRDVVIYKINRYELQVQAGDVDVEVVE